MRKWFVIAALGDLIILALLIACLTGCATEHKWQDDYQEIYPGCIVHKKV